MKELIQESLNMPLILFGVTVFVGLIIAGTIFYKNRRDKKSLNKLDMKLSEIVAGERTIIQKLPAISNELKVKQDALSLEDWLAQEYREYLKDSFIRPKAKPVVSVKQETKLDTSKADNFLRSMLENAVAE